MMSATTASFHPLARRAVAGAAPALAALLLSAAGSALAAPPVVYNIGVMPGGSYTQGLGLSGDGTTVTGSGNTTFGGGGSVIRPFRWVAPAGPIQVIPLTTDSEGHGVSFSGQHVVGHTINATVLPFRWTVASGFTPMNLLAGGTSAFAYATTFSGNASAGFGNSSAGFRAIRWNSSGAAQDLGILPGQTASNPSSTGYGISPDGSVVVGSASWAPGVAHAMRWNMPFGPMQSLGTLPGRSAARAFAVSTDNSTIVGDSSFLFSSGDPRAFRLKAPAPMLDLGFIPGSGGPSLLSQALAVSGNGSRVVGWSFDNTFGTRAFIWMSSTGMIDLKAYVASLGGAVTGWAFEQATGISSDGTAVCGRGTFNGQTRAFLIQGLPCLNPTAWWLPDNPPTTASICADPNWPVGSGPGLPGASASFTLDADGSEPLVISWFVTVGELVGTPPQPITGPIFEDLSSGLAFSVEGLGSPTITISNLRPSPNPPTFWIGGTVTNPCGSAATLSHQVTVTGLCAPPSGPCSPADIAGTDGSPGHDHALDNGDFQLFFSHFFSANCPDCGTPPNPATPPTPCNPADIAATDGAPSLVGDGCVDNGDFSLFFTAFFAGCP